AVTLDSGLLYVAEALRVPTISLWGTHAPAVRLGYDPAYMDLAIWPRENCGAAPCFAYANFPYASL
ncbi:MAG TPA: glycosyltransferase family 9 protein, partial [Leptospiraceae bacterium]|nr:glycosyltransferase family 9 protein [Leptospiraceae bacterium]